MRREIYKSIPNLLSLLRIPLAYGFIFAYFYGGSNSLAIAIVLAALVTDVADGAVARRLSAVTESGKLIDPFADKFIELTVLVCLGVSDVLPLWLVALYIVKEAAMVICGYSLLKRKNIVVSSNYFGKTTTAIFYVVVLLVLFFPSLAQRGSLVHFSLCLAATLSCIVSALAYLVRYKPALMLLRGGQNNSGTHK